MGRKGSKKRSKHIGGSEGHPARSAADRPSGAISAQEVPDRWRPWLLAGAVGLLVARPLYPSETPADTGDGLPLVMLWLALAVVWMLGLLGRRSFTIRFGLLDAAVVFLVTWHVVSALLGASRSQPRPAVNMLWEWVGLGLVFLLVRQWVAGSREIRAVVAVMLALAVALAGYGLFQCVYEFPRTRAAYHADPEKALQEAGFYYPPGSPERIAFEKRLESREPIATFALTNSLAGFLTPWLAAAVGIGLLGGGWSAGWRPRVGLVGGWLLMAACLLLTKSRSAYLAVLAGLGSVGGWWLWIQLRQGLRPHSPFPPLGESQAEGNYSPLPSAEQGGLQRRPGEGSNSSIPPAGESQAEGGHSPFPSAGEGRVRGKEENGDTSSSISPPNPASPSAQPGSPPEGRGAPLTTGTITPETTQIVSFPKKPRYLPRPFLYRTILGLISVLFVVGFLIAGVWYWGGLDIQVLTEAGKSLQYRWEYWQATWQIIRQAPVWGCGPGLFRYAYTQFKLPQASEEIADPHNFLLEIGATAGTPALLVMLVFLVVWLAQVVRISRAGAVVPLPPMRAEAHRTGPIQAESPGKLLVGAAAGVAVGFWVGQWSAAPPSLYVLMIGLPLGAATVWAFWPWVQTGGNLRDSTILPPTVKSEPSTKTTGAKGSRLNCLPGVLSLAVGALLVNLLAAGGISFAGVAGSLWLLAALATGTPWLVGALEPNTTNSLAFSAGVASRPSKEIPVAQDSSGREHSHSPRQTPEGWWGSYWLNWLDRQYEVGWPGAIGGLVLTMAVFFACHQTAFSPVLERQTLMHQAIRFFGMEPERAEKLLHQAAAADPLSAQPVEWLSALAFQQWHKRFEQRPNEPAHWVAQLHQVEQYAFLALELNPEDAPAWFVQGERFLEIGRLLLVQSPPQARRAFQRALGFFQQAASLYPNNALYRARLAETFAALGYQPGMIRQAQAALWLDEQMPHVEKKLPEPLRRQLAKMQEGLNY